MMVVFVHIIITITIIDFSSDFKTSITLIGKLLSSAENNDEDEDEDEDEDGVVVC